MSTAPRTEGASGTGLATLAADGSVLDTWFPVPALGPDAPDVAADLEALVGADEARGVRTAVV
ncbi:MAG: 2,3,4,5-tetrahydropyridine-2,6-dicarboxylate N-succinyltransferase, partial [Actinomycetes bacterium]